MLEPCPIRITREEFDTRLRSIHAHVNGRDIERLYSRGEPTTHRPSHRARHANLFGQLEIAAHQVIVSTHTLSFNLHVEDVCAVEDFHEGIIGGILHDLRYIYAHFLVHY